MNTPLEMKVEKRLAETGSTWLPYEKVKDLDLKMGFEQNLLVKRTRKGRCFVTTAEIAQMETSCAKAIAVRALKAPKRIVPDDVIERLIHEFEKTKGEAFSLSETQREAVKTMVNSNLCILTGGPGTGKTSILQCVAYVLIETNPERIEIQFTAPTGKASKRITEASGYLACTTLKYTGGMGDNKIKRRCPDYLFVDEASMIDLKTLHILVQSLFKNVTLFFVGDSNQLPSVEIGSVLRDLIDTDFIPHICLTQTFRQDNSSTLYDNIKIVNDGCPVELSDGSDFKRIPTEENVLKNCVDEYLAGVERYGCEETVILSPYRKAGTICSNKLNTELQNIINPPADSRPSLKTVVKRRDEVRNMTFRVGDPVIALEPHFSIANGEIGKVIEVKKGIVTVQYTGETFSYSGKTLCYIDLAYAISVHKSQGSGATRSLLKR